MPPQWAACSHPDARFDRTLIAQAIGFERNRGRLVTSADTTSTRLLEWD